MPTTNLEEVVGDTVLADAEVRTADARTRLKAGQLGPPMSLLVKWTHSRRQASNEKRGVCHRPSAGPESCALAVTQRELVAVQTQPGWRRNKATAVLTRVPRTSIDRASIGTGVRADMVIHFAGGDQWVFEVLGGAPRRACERVVSALGF